MYLLNINTYIIQMFKHLQLYKDEYRQNKIREMYDIHICNADKKKCYLYKYSIIKHQRYQKTILLQILNIKVQLLLNK